MANKSWLCNKGSVISWSRNVPIEIRSFPHKLRSVDHIRHRYTNYEVLIKQLEQSPLPAREVATAYWTIKERVNGDIYNELYLRTLYERKEA